MTRTASPSDRQAAADLDGSDPLRQFRSRFIIEDPELIYMDGNSLGRLPNETKTQLADFVHDGWGRELVTGWHAWIDLPAEIGDILARLIGADLGEVVVCDSTSINLYKLAMAAITARPGRSRIITDRGNFPSDRYILEGIAKSKDLHLEMIEFDFIEGPTQSALGPHLDDDVALVCLSHVDFRSGALANMQAITKSAHDAGALVIWDLCHSVGVVPVELGDSQADLAVGCTYKYLNGGPGAPAFLYVRKDLQEELVQPIWGWFGHGRQFEMPADYEPASGIRKFQVGTPPLVALKGVEVGGRLTLEAGIYAIRLKSIALTELIVSLFDEWLEPLGFLLGSPRDPSRRGSHVALRHPDAWRLCRALIERCKVIPDFREPDVIRFGVAPLYTTFVDTWDAVKRLRDAASGGLHLEFESAKQRVT